MKAAHVVRIRSIIGVELLLLVASCQAQVRMSQPDLNQVLSWLPPDTETIIAANGPFSLPDPKAFQDEAQERRGFSEELEFQMETLPLPLFHLNNGDLINYLKGRTVVLAMEGSRHFRSPEALGLMLYEGCEIVFFDSTAKLDSEAFIKNAGGSAKRVETIQGMAVAVFEEEQENDTWTTFVAFPRSNVILIATNAEYLGSVIARMRVPRGPRALRTTLTEWKYLNTRASVWGVRHFQTHEFELDPSSPFLEQAPASIPDNKAVGVTRMVGG